MQVEVAKKSEPIDAGLLILAQLRVDFHRNWEILQRKKGEFRKALALHSNPEQEKIEENQKTQNKGGCHLNFGAVEKLFEKLTAFDALLRKSEAHKRWVLKKGANP